MKTIFALLITALMAGFGGYFFAMQQNGIPVSDTAPEPSPSLTPDKAFLPKLYESDAGFSFRYPLGHAVNENIDPEDPNVTNIFILDEAVPSPVLQINVSDGFVSFSLWEGASWKYLSDVIASFALEGQSK